MTDAWNKLVTYREGERCRFNGLVLEAKMDLVRGLRPDGKHWRKFWQTVPTIAVPKSAGASRPAAKPQRQSADLERAVDRISEIVHHSSGSRSPGQYLTRDFTVESKRRHGPARK